MRHLTCLIAIGTMTAALAGCQADRGMQGRNENGSADAAQAAAAQMSPGSTNDASQNLQPDDDLQPGAKSTQPSNGPDIRQLRRFD